MHVQSNGGWLGGWLGGRLGGWLAGRPKPPPPPPRWLAQLLRVLVASTARNGAQEQLLTNSALGLRHISRKVCLPQYCTKAKDAINVSLLSPSFSTRNSKSYTI